MDTLKLFFETKQITPEKVLFKIHDGTNVMSDKEGGLQRRTGHYSPFNIYMICHNHCLALCLPHIVKNKKFSEMLADYDALLLGL